ncbi:MAG TPA: hypothetical protein VHC69_00525 [Polyangiaceae bacterium]|nr:hypothetical protein [Polyangiaceae bacterium]
MSLSCALLLGSPALRAEADLPVRVQIGECPDLDAAEIRRIASVELRARPSDAEGPDVLDIGVTCDGPRVVIRVKDPLSRKAVQRSFNLGLSDPKARSRLVAIAATELVLASWAELQVGRPLTVPPEGGAPGEGERRVASVALTQTLPHAQAGARAASAPVPSAPYEPYQRHWYDLEAPPDRMFRVVAVASGRKFFRLPGLLWGGGVRAGEERFHFMSWSADGIIETGSVGSPSNRYDLLTATVGGALLVWARVGPVTGRVGVGLRAGIAEVGSTASSVAPWGWPLGTSSISIRLSRHFVFDIAGEAGYVVLPSGHAGQADLKGGWFSGQLGVGMVPAPNAPARARAVEEEE